MDIFDKTTRKIMEKSREEDGRHGCILWEGAKYSSGYGRIRNTFPGPPNEIHVHRLMYMASIKSSTLEKVDEAGHVLDVSHICHCKSCVKPEHLVLENHETNMERMHCISQGVCTRNHLPHCLL